MLHALYLIIHNRRFWRRIKMSELSELYVSMTLKSLALSLVAVFVPVYFYQLGLSIQEIVLYFAVYFFIRVPLNIISGELTAYYGPKHIMSYSYVFLLVFLALLLTMPVYFWPLWLLAVVHAGFNSLFYVSYHVDFSKIQDSFHSGKQLSLMNIFVRAAAALGPFIGGAIATLFGMEFTLGLAAIIVLVAILPLMMTKEPIRLGKRPNYASFSIKKQWRNIIAYSGLAVERQVNLIAWPLFLAAFVFTSSRVYADVGLVTSVAIAVSLIMARVYGHIVDNNDGRYLLNFASVTTAVVDVFRLFVSSMTGVLAVNTGAELFSTGGMIAFTKGFYGEADSVADRVAYISVTESIIAFVRSLSWLLILVLIVQFGERYGLMSGFVIAAFSSLLVMSQKFKTL